MWKTFNASNDMNLGLDKCENCTFKQRKLTPNRESEYNYVRILKWDRISDSKIKEKSLNVMKVK